MASGPPEDVSMTDRQSPPPVPSEEPKLGGFTRFEVELEFVQSLASPMYLNHLASLKFFENPAFVAYLAYLQYWAQQPYTKYLTYPGPTLKHLEMLQQERFRADILSPDVAARLAEEEVKAAAEWPSS
ncbi:SOH1-domain-containing protein [Halenospora varia]|nr:SOH1-domain-containing protein [Halenospora varia]